MTPEAAAALLEVGPGARAEEIERAFKRRARAVHPDRFVGESPERVKWANGEFARLSQARLVALANVDVVRTQGEAPIFVPARGAWKRRPPGGWGLFATTTGALLAASGSFAAFGPNLLFPLTILLQVVLSGFAIALALTGTRVALIGTSVLVGMSAALTLADISFAALLTLFLLIVMVIAMGATGRERYPGRWNARRP